MKKWVIVAINGRFEVSKAESLRALKRDTRNQYEWKGDVCEVLLWDAKDYVPSEEKK